VTTNNPALPIDAVLADILASLGAVPNLVLKAPPGAGKTTRVPLALLEAGFARGGKILVIEPRRVAARAAARRMAETLGEHVGETVGWRMRMDTKVGPKTRIEVMTDGLFTRRLQADPELTGIAAVLFDEFHERRLELDLGLALALEAQAALTPDLRLVAMSATLDGLALGDLMHAPIIEAQGRAYPVDIRYAPPGKQRLEEDIAAVIKTALREDDGDILAFLPGAAEIERTKRALHPLDPAIILHTLHGDLSAELQDRVLLPDPSGRRKIILSTAIAETSLTIEGVRIVIDSGLSRVSRFDPNSAMSRLDTVRITQAGATQRAGRAGRTAPGVCYRIWTEAETRGLLPYPAPEILEADLAPLALELALWGAGDPQALSFQDPPPESNLAAARDLLQRLGTLDADHRITPHGKSCSQMGLHPRLAHMIITARGMGLGRMAALVAALLSDRDPMRGTGAHLTERIEVLAGSGRSNAPVPQMDRIKRMAKLWTERDDPPLDHPISPEDVGLLIALAYPDRIAVNRASGDGSFRLTNGRGAVIDTLDALSSAPYLAIADLDGPARGAKIRLAAPVSLEILERLYAGQIVDETITVWNPREEAVNARRIRRLGQAVLEDRPDQKPDPAAQVQALIAGIRSLGLSCLPFDHAADQIRARAQLLARVDPVGGWPDMSDAALLDSLEIWLAPDLIGRTRRAHLKDVHMDRALARLFPYPLDRNLERLAPTHLTVPTGSQIALDYTGEAPVLAVRLQEVFGQKDTPRIADGRVGVVLHLLSPAGRPVQITADLAGFWRTSYAAVRADLRGRYPKHAWPDDPANATPMRTTKKRHEQTH
jgi:ATP-dependent helicase HrpB